MEQELHNLVVPGIILAVLVVLVLMAHNFIARKMFIRGHQASTLMRRVGFLVSCRIVPQEDRDVVIQTLSPKAFIFYNAVDPLEITICITEGSDDPWELCLERRFLARLRAAQEDVAVTAGPTLSGSVHRSMVGNGKQRILLFQVADEYADRVVTFRYEEIMKFLALTERTVPLDNEGQFLHESLDAELEELVNSTS